MTRLPRTGTALTAATVACLALTGLAPARAVAPQSATITADCDRFGRVAGTLTATHSGTSATLTLRAPGIKAPIGLARDSVASTLTLTRAGGGTVAFTGRRNAAAARGAAVTIGPLTGRVARGDRLEAYGGSLRMTLFGITLTCRAAGRQAPGPFVFA
ncbi:hypothetical protein [Streptomyces sp. NPDC003717]|uniref:hypothetical protein n=1 Tax=Streptomyces sp. NPDC003717 TaxID=3154276 RepID=UPI0033A3C9B0